MKPPSFSFCSIFFTEGHHTTATNQGYSRKKDGGFFTCWPALTYLQLFCCFALRWALVLQSECCAPPPPPPWLLFKYHKHLLNTLYSVNHASSNTLAICAYTHWHTVIEKTVTLFLVVHCSDYFAQPGVLWNTTLYMLKISHIGGSTSRVSRAPCVEHSYGLRTCLRWLLKEHHWKKKERRTCLSKAPTNKTNISHTPPPPPQKKRINNMFNKYKSCCLFVWWLLCTWNWK